ncbi:MAG: hypothetical protein ACREGR_00195 [Minisyncoccia bacterium]
MSNNTFPEGAALLHNLFRGTNGELGAMFDLSNVPPKKREIERKYEIGGREGVDQRMTVVLSRMATLLEEKHLVVKRFQPFVGIDQYWILELDGRKVTYRYRYSANVLSELTVKAQIVTGQNEQRAEFNLDLRDADVQSVRAFMSTVCGFVPGAKHFCITQSGHFWKLLDTNGRSAEIVLYKVGLLKKEASHVFCEIEARNFDKPEDAIASIEEIEGTLGLSESRCDKSIAEIFGK